MIATPSNICQGILRKLAEAHRKKPLTDKMMKGMIPFYVEKAKHRSADHKCGNCFMRTGQEGCTIVGGKISFRNGTCWFWGGGPASPASKIHPQRMSYAQAGYVETDGKVQCASCRHMNDDYQNDEGRRYCALWDGLAFNEDCCPSWDNPSAVVPS